jgi:oligoendopeptidase F
MELSKTDKKYSIEEAKEICLDTLQVFGDEYITVVKKAFAEN